MLQPFGVSDDRPGVARRRPAEPGEEKSLLVPGHLGEASSGHTELWLEERASASRNKGALSRPAEVSLLACGPHMRFFVTLGTPRFSPEVVSGQGAFGSVTPLPPALILGQEWKGQHVWSSSGCTGAVPRTLGGLGRRQGSRAQQPRRRTDQGPCLRA